VPLAVWIPRARVGALLASLLLLLGAAGQARADSGDPLSYYGGPVVHSATGVLVNWGPQVSSIYTNPNSGDPALLGFLARSSGSTADVGGVLAQYMDATGQNSANHFAYGQDYQISPTVTGTTIQDSQVASELVSQIQAGALPAPPGDGLSTVYLVLFPPGDTICMSASDCSGQTFCAYHESTTMPDGTNVLYAVLPDNTSGPMTQGCGSEPTALQDQTSYLSHEFSEAINDPLVGQVSSLGAPLAWYDGNCPNSNSLCGEIGDKCDQRDAIEGGFAVQTEWSNLDRTCVGSESRFAPPTATFSAPANAQPGSALQFSAAGSSDSAADHTSAVYAGQTYSIGSGIAQYVWNWGDGNPLSGGASPTHKYASVGIYAVTLTVTDNLGFTSTVTRMVGVGEAVPSSGGAGGSGGATGTSGSGNGSTAVTSQGELGSAAAAVPRANTGRARLVGGRRATLSGTVARRGQTVHYYFEYGRSSRYGHGSPVAVIARGGDSLNVSAPIAGLAPRTRYHFRLVVQSRAGTSFGADRTFTTRAAGPRAPQLRVRARHTLRLIALLHGPLNVGFACDSACTVHVSLTPLLARIATAASTPRTLAAGTGRLQSAGAGVVAVRLLPGVGRWLAPRGLRRMIVRAYATGPGGAAGAPQAFALTLA
jgi:PKD domain